MADEGGQSECSRHSKALRPLWGSKDLEQGREPGGDGAGMTGWAGQGLNALLLFYTETTRNHECSWVKKEQSIKLPKDNHGSLEDALKWGEEIRT